MPTQLYQVLPVEDRFNGIGVHQVKVGRGHRYTVDGEFDYKTSVTTILNVINKPALVNWAKTDTAERIRDRLMAVEADNLPGEDIYPHYIATMTEEEAKRPPVQRNDGSLTHALIEHHITGYMPELEFEVSELDIARVQPAVDGAKRILREMRLEPVAIEIPLWHPDYDYAGTVDYLGALPGGDLVIMDWKRSKRPYDEYAYQVAAYAEALKAVLADKDRVVKGYVSVLAQERGQFSQAHEVKKLGRSFETFRRALGLQQQMSLDRTKGEKVWE